MAGDRYVVLGLGMPRSPWFRSVAQWATSGSLPVEFVKVVSVEELHARLASGRRFSALLVDGAISGVDRDLLDRTRSTGCAVIVTGDDRRDWEEAGADAVLPAAFDQRDLLDVLRGTSVMIGRADTAAAATTTNATVAPAAWRGRMAAVCGSGGTGASTVAIALAQGAAADVRNGGLVVLADMARPGEQAMLHDARDVVPGIEELVEAHRAGAPTGADVRSHTFHVESRGYALLLGLRRTRSWSALRPRAVEAAVAGLARSFRVVVADCDADLEGEADGGSADVEDRNAMARCATSEADVVFAVGLPGLKGVHSLVRVIGDLMAAGVDGARIVVVVNRAPRSHRARAEVARAIADLTPARRKGLAAPVFLPERSLDPHLRDGTRLPAVLCAPLVAAFDEVAATVGRSVRAAPEPVAVVPGSLGHWDDDQADVG
jgi:MinD-like ATPase involved in chromosome partitioning or flagellar assembly